jgi:hypothetical protein
LKSKLGGYRRVIDSLKDALEDGTNIEIYVRNTALEDWEALFSVAKMYRYSFDGGDRDPDFPPVTNDLFAPAPSGVFFIDLGGVTLEGCIFHIDEIELWFFPGENFTSAHLALVHDFMRQLGNACGRKVILTPESAPDHPVFVYSPNDSAVLAVE